MGVFNHLAEHRRRFDLTQAELGRRVGISRQALHNLESGKTVPPVDVALRLARTLGEPVETLFEARDTSMASTHRLDELLRAILPLRSLLRERGVEHLSIFGSYARGEASESSDVDVLIEPRVKGFSVFDLVWVRQALEHLLKRRVDVVTKGSLRRGASRRVLQDRVRVF